MIRTIVIRTILTLTFSGALCTAFGQTPCENLKSLNLPNVTFTRVESVPEGPFVPPTGPGAAQAAAAGAPVGRGGGGRGPAAPPLMLKAHCRAAMVLAPSSDSKIEMELWLPEAADWNGKFQAQGNGGWAGAITFPAMAQALKEGYATASNDTGHTGGDPAFGLGHTEKLVDFAWRANHEMTVQSKAIISAYYGKTSKLNFWNGCSTGGRQGLMEAQKFPADFDAVIAGAPANFQTHLHAWDMNVATTAIKDGQMFMTPGKLATLNKAVLAQCDAMDGVKDGLLNDPRKCKFDPGVLLCKGPDSDACLTAKQVEGAKLVYAAAKKKNGEFIFPGKEPGSELVWTQLNAAKAPIPLILGTFQVATYQDANWDWHNYDLGRDVAAADEKFGYVNAPYDLSAFKARGGKLLLYHGWNDTAISPENTINYYQNVLQKMGPKQDSWMRLYMVPGMNHCQGGVGPDQFNKMAVMERWRESNTAPEQILAAHVTGTNVDMTRPLCPYPQVATYKGTGSTNDAASFTCKAPTQ
jgi:feruloyl esterase